jgi:hypothetical protein
MGKPLTKSTIVELPNNLIFKSKKGEEEHESLQGT